MYTPNNTKLWPADYDVSEAGSPLLFQSRMAEHDAVRKLWIAVLRQAIDEVRSSKDRFARSALSWLCGHDSSRAGSFSFVCMTLGLGPEKVRRMVAKQLLRDARPRVRQRALVMKVEKEALGKPVLESTVRIRSSKKRRGWPSELRQHNASS